jgi:hypothetical protein
MRGGHTQLIEYYHDKESDIVSKEADCKRLENDIRHTKFEIEALKQGISPGKLRNYT